MAALPRIHCPQALVEGEALSLPESACRHVQVLRLQPGDRITLFGADPSAGDIEFESEIEQMGRREVRVRVLRRARADRERARALHLAVGMPANERMDWLVEKATELGVASIQPLVTERTVVRLDAERAERRVQHWRAIAIAACEQCGRNRVPGVAAPLTFQRWLDAQSAEASGRRWVLSLHPDARDLRRQPGGEPSEVLVLCGPEGGLTEREEAQAVAAGFMPASLGPCTLRVETAALAALTLLA